MDNLKTRISLLEQKQTINFASVATSASKLKSGSNSIEITPSTGSVYFRDITKPVTDSLAINIPEQTINNVKKINFADTSVITGITDEGTEDRTKALSAASALKYDEKLEEHEIRINKNSNKITENTEKLADHENLITQNTNNITEQDKKISANAEAIAIVDQELEDHKLEYEIMKNNILYKKVYLKYEMNQNNTPYCCSFSIADSDAYFNLLLSFYSVKTNGVEK